MVGLFLESFFEKRGGFLTCKGLGASKIQQAFQLLKAGLFLGRPGKILNHIKIPLRAAYAYIPQISAIYLLSIIPQNLKISSPLQYIIVWES